MSAWIENEHGDRIFTDEGWTVTHWRNGVIDIDAPKPGCCVYVSEGNLRVYGHGGHLSAPFPAVVNIPWAIVQAIIEARTANLLRITPNLLNHPAGGSLRH